MAVVQERTALFKRRERAKQVLMKPSNNNTMDRKHTGHGIIAENWEIPAWYCQHIGLLRPITLCFALQGNTTAKQILIYLQVYKEVALWSLDYATSAQQSMCVTFSKKTTAA